MTILLALVAVALALWLALTFNRLIRLRNQYRTAWADIDVQLQRRHDLVPPLVETVRGYAAHERATLEAVTELRAQAQAARGATRQGQAESALEQALGRMIALQEAYPDLKASQNFSQLSAALVPHAPRGTAAVMAAGFALFILLVAFGFLLPAPTPEGRKLLDEIDGLKLYLGVAERDDLARLQAPSLDAGRFESLLPFAVALDVEEAWTKKFTAAVGDAVAQQVTSNLSWYQGSSFNNLTQFSSSLSSGLSSSIASASTPPGSSSGGGGGGSSGGGGGGGGGGGR